MALKCHACQKALDAGDSVFVLTSAMYGQRMSEKPEFGWGGHFSPLRAWCYVCGLGLWSGVSGECPFCQDALTVGAAVFCLVSGDIPKPAYRSLERRSPRFVAHKPCFEKRYPDLSN